MDWIVKFRTNVIKKFIKYSLSFQCSTYCGVVCIVNTCKYNKDRDWRDYQNKNLQTQNKRGKSNWPIYWATIFCGTEITSHFRWFYSSCLISVYKSIALRVLRKYFNKFYLNCFVRSAHKCIIMCAFLGLQFPLCLF